MGGTGAGALGGAEETETCPAGVAPSGAVDRSAALQRPPASCCGPIGGTDELSRTNRRGGCTAMDQSEGPRC
eukprot:1180296-Prorocentrum_minimum.AAC.3